MRIKYVYGENRKGVWLREEEIKGLELLHSLSYLSMDSLYKYVTSIGSYKITANAFRNRIRDRYIKYDLVHRHFYSFGQQGFGYVYLSMKSNGINLLRERGVISKVEMEDYRFKDISQNQQDHTLATRAAVVDILVEEKENVVFTSKLTFSHCSASQLVYNDNRSKDHVYVVPDWIIQNGNRTLNIELDTGRQNLSVIKSKIQMYVKYVNQHPDQEHVVLFSVLDNSFRSRTDYGTRERRVESLKLAISEMDELKSCENLQVYVVSYHRTNEVAYKILRSGDVQEKQAINYRNLERSLKLLMNKREVLVETFDVTSSPFFDMGIKIRCDGVELIAFALIINEGSVTDFTRGVMAQSFLLSSDKKHESRIMFVYSSEIERNHDVQQCLLEPIRISYLDNASLMLGKEGIKVSKSTYTKKDSTLMEWLFNRERNR